MLASTIGLKAYRYETPELSMPESSLLLFHNEPNAGLQDMSKSEKSEDIQIVSPTGTQEPSDTDPDAIVNPTFPHEIMASIIEHATGYVPSFGLDTSYQSPFDCRDPPEEKYRDGLMAAQETASTLRRVSPWWLKDIELLQERHSLIVDLECDWEEEIARFESRLGERTYRLTLVCERMGTRLGVIVPKILDTLTNIQVLSFAGFIDKAYQTEVAEHINNAISRLVYRNHQHITYLMWHNRDIDIIPLTPLCENLEILVTNSKAIYSKKDLEVLAGATLKRVHSIHLAICNVHAKSCGIFTLLSTWNLPSLKALAVDSEICPKDLYEFLGTSGNSVECLILSEERNKHDDPDLPILPQLPKLTQLALPVRTAEQHFSVPKPFVSLQDISLVGFDHMSMKCRRTRVENLRTLVRVVMRLRSKTNFPSLRLVRLDSFDVTNFEKIRWYPFEEVALNLVSNALKERGVKLEDHAGNDLHECVPHCRTMNGGEVDFDAQFDNQM